MTITEAKKIIEMCADAVRKTDGDDAKIYVNKEYVLSILDMVEEPAPITWPDYPYPWNPMQPGVTYKDSDHWVWKKVSTGTGDNDLGEWHLFYEKGLDPYTPYCGDINSTGQNPTPEIHVTAADLSKAAYHDTSMNPNDGTITTAQNNIPTHQYVEKFNTASSDSKNA